MQSKPKTLQTPRSIKKSKASARDVETRGVAMSKEAPVDDPRQQADWNLPENWTTA
jgi:hypothetical protein